MFDHPDFEHESVTYFEDKETGLRAIIAIHDTTLGNSMGGTRMWNYNSESEALTDVLRLSKGMTYKSALAGLNLGGGKSVIIGDKSQKTPELFEAFGKAVETLGGKYIAAEDVGVSITDLEHARKHTVNISGIAEGNVGNPSPATAWGVYNGILAAVKYRFNKDSVEDIKVAVSGLGNVGYELCRLLHANGARLIISDINDEIVTKAVDEFEVNFVDPECIHQMEVDVYAPCALGGILNSVTITDLYAPIIAGAANNQLENEYVGKFIANKGKLYAPDYAINAGGIMIISKEGDDFNREKEMKWIGDSIYNTLTDIFERADASNINTNKMADILAMERLKNIRDK